MKVLPRLRNAQSEADVQRPAFYALASGRWRDYITVLHPPYTLWHLSYVVLGAALAPTIRYECLGATLLAFFLAVGVAAHTLDEVNGRPLKTRIPDGILYWLAGLSLAGAIGLGLAGTIVVSPWLASFTLFGAFIVLAYNLEWFGGRFHSDFWFALSWGAFPFLTAYWASAETLAPSAAAGAAAVFALTLAQRTLSTRVRNIRRRVLAIEGVMVYTDGTRQTLSKQESLAADERALLLLSISITMFALATLLLRIY